MRGNMLEKLTHKAPKVDIPTGVKPCVEFDGFEGTAQTPGYADGSDFKEYLAEAGFDLENIEILDNTMRVSRWQVYDGSWRSSYRFRFRLLNGERADLPLLYKTAKSNIPKRTPKEKTDKALVILWSDLQVGKSASLGGTEELIQRVAETTQRLIEHAKSLKPSRILFCDVGDIVEGFENKANLAQLQSNSLSLMQQIDVATTLTWDALKGLTSACDDIAYLTVGSNHCQWRVNKQQVGTATDDWGVHIGRTLARLAKETKLPITFYEPQTHDESLAFDVFDDGYHVLGLFHGHQAARPDGIPAWIRGQMFGNLAVTNATVFASGHFHHLAVKELGATPRGASRFWVQAKTLDNGSDWFKRMSGESATPGLVTFTLEKEKDFQGEVKVL